VAELVGDDALELVAREFFEGAAGDGDDGVAGGEAGGEGVEAALVIEEVDGRHGHAGGDGHLLDDVEQALLGEVGGLRVHAAAADHLGDDGAAGAQLQPFEKHRAAGDEADDEGNSAEKAPVPDEPRARRGPDAGDDDQGRQVTSRDHADHGQDEQQHQPRSAALGAGLGLEEIHKESRPRGGGRREGGRRWISW